jgi:hypothetical protein
MDQPTTNTNPAGFLRISIPLTSVNKEAGGSERERESPAESRKWLGYLHNAPQEVSVVKCQMWSVAISLPALSSTARLSVSPVPLDGGLVLGVCVQPHRRIQDSQLLPLVVFHRGGNRGSQASQLTLSTARRNHLLQVDGLEVDATLHSGLSGMALVDPLPWAWSIGTGPGLKGFADVRQDRGEDARRPHPRGTLAEKAGVGINTIVIASRPNRRRRLSRQHSQTSRGRPCERRGRDRQDCPRG